MLTHKPKRTPGIVKLAFKFLKMSSWAPVQTDEDAGFALVNKNALYDMKKDMLQQQLTQIDVIDKNLNELKYAKC